MNSLLPELPVTKTGIMVPGNLHERQTGNARIHGYITLLPDCCAPDLSVIGLSLWPISTVPTSMDHHFGRLRLSEWLLRQDGRHQRWQLLLWRRLLLLQHRHPSSESGHERRHGITSGWLLSLALSFHEEEEILGHRLILHSDPSVSQTQL